jgi:hypothetical protein
MPRYDIGYDFEDFGMGAAALEAKYESLISEGQAEHPVYNQAAYTTYAAMPTRDVALSYWDWVVSQIREDDDAMPSNVQEPAAQAFQDQLTEQQADDAELVDIQDVNQFAEYIVNWHQNRLAQIRYFQRMPEGQTVSVTLNGVTSEIVLAGEVYKGFQAGLLTAILQIDSLPFAVSVIDASAPKH